MTSKTVKQSDFHDTTPVMPDLKIICQICDARTHNIEQLEYHISNWHQGHKYLCKQDNCWHVFSSCYTFVSHVKKNAQNQYF